MIRIEHVEKSYGKRPVLKDVSLEVPTGSVTVIIGPSGSGKTTFLRTINFLGPADKGTLQLDEEPIIDMKRASKRKSFMSAAIRPWFFSFTIFFPI